jgi:transcriptional regulator with XRE-family HTH domain
VQGRSSNQIVADAIRRERKAAHLSQEALADLCNLHRTYIGAIERGEENITLNTLDKVAKALKVKPRILLGCDE